MIEYIATILRGKIEENKPIPVEQWIYNTDGSGNPITFTIEAQDWNETGTLEKGRKPILP